MIWIGGFKRKERGASDFKFGLRHWKTTVSSLSSLNTQHPFSDFQIISKHGISGKNILLTMIKNRYFKTASIMNNGKMSVALRFNF